MKDLFSKCGYKCSSCPSYKENIKTAEDRRRCSDGWQKYHGFRITAPKIRACDGCQTSDDKNPLLYISCRVRKCAQRNGVRTCAYCSIYPCEDVSQIGNVADLLERTAARLKAPIPEKDYSVFIEPYEGIKHLDRIRASLLPQDIEEMKPVSLKIKTFDFPEDLPFSREKTAAYQALHHLLLALNTIEGVSFARKEALNLRRKHLLNILWGFGLRGRFDREEDHLEMNSEAYRQQKLLSYPFKKVESLLSAFQEFGVRCQFIPLEEGGWLTPTGALKSGPWLVRMSFDKRIGEADTLVALKEYSSLLEEKYGGEAFKHFAQADMCWLMTTHN
jgi:hypothetical protein